MSKPAPPRIFRVLASVRAYTRRPTGGTNPFIEILSGMTCEVLDEREGDFVRCRLRDDREVWIDENYLL